MNIIVYFQGKCCSRKGVEAVYEIRMGPYPVP